MVQATDSDGQADWRGADPALRRAGTDGLAPDDVPRKDVQLATEDGARRELIDGVRIREARTIADDRGTICVAYDPRWGFSDEPMVYTYEVRSGPGRSRAGSSTRHTTTDSFLPQGR
jgi:hypothetical protein